MVPPDPDPDLDPDPGPGPAAAGEQPNRHQRRWPAEALTELELRGGQLVVAKRRPPAGRWATVAEGRWLRRARHPGVVPLRLVDPGAGLVETLFRGAATLRTAGMGTGIGPERAAAVLAPVAATVVELHRRGLVHGRLWPEHVVVRRAGPACPLLCSPSPEAAWLGPARDVADLGRLARHLVGRYPDRDWDEVIEQLEADPRATAGQALAWLSRLRDGGRRRLRRRWRGG